MHHIYRVRKKKRLIRANLWEFKQISKNNEWYIGYTNELTYQMIEDLDLEYIGCMSYEQLELAIR